MSPRHCIRTLGPRASSSKSTCSIFLALRDFKLSDFFLKATALAVDSNPSLASVVASADKAALGVAETRETLDAGLEATLGSSVSHLPPSGQRH